MRYELGFPLAAIAGAAVAAAILLLAIRRGRRHATAYLDLWERALAGAPLWERWLRRMPSTPILLLATGAALAGLAAAEPRRLEPAEVDLLYVVDRSATMATREGDSTRLELAKRWIESQLSRLASADRVGLATAARTLEARVSPTTDREELRRALAALEVEPAGSDLRPAAAALESFPIPTILVSDLAAGKVAFAATKVVGEASDNCGIVDLAVTDPFPDVACAVAVTLRHEGTKGTKRSVVLTRGGAEVARAEAILEAEGETTVRIPFERGPGGLHQLSLVPGDAFSLDDEATFLVEAPAGAPIVLVRNATGPSAPLEAAARALALELQVPLGSTSDAHDAPDDAVVFQEGGSLPKLPRRAFLWGVESPELSKSDATASGAIVAPASGAILGIDGRSPLIRGLLLDRLVVKPNIALRDRGDALVRGSGGPLIVAVDEAGERAVATAFRVADGNFPILDGAFPVFARRAFLWLARSGRRAVPFARSGLDPAGPLDGRPERGPGRLGPWSLPSGEPTTVSLLDRASASIAPPAERPEPPLPSAPPRTRDLGAVLAVAAAAALAAALLLELAVHLGERRRGALFREASAL